MSCAIRSLRLDPDQYDGNGSSQTHKRRDDGTRGTHGQSSVARNHLCTSASAFDSRSTRAGASVRRALSPTHRSSQGMRAKLEFELAKAKADVATAEAELVAAEAGLANAIIDRDQTDASHVASLPSVVMARVRCRQARTQCHDAHLRHDQLASAFAELYPAQAIGKAGGKTGKATKGAAENSGSGSRVPPADRGTDPPSTRPIEFPVGEMAGQQKTASHEKRFSGASGASWRKYLAPRGAPAVRLLARERIMLLGLVLAYLQFYFLDVYLQIARLPSLIVAPLFG